MWMFIPVKHACGALIWWFSLYKLNFPVAPKSCQMSLYSVRSFTSGESVEENAYMVLRLLIRRPECFGPALQGDGGNGLLAAVREAIRISDDASADGPSSPHPSNRTMSVVNIWMVFKVQDLAQSFHRSGVNSSFLIWNLFSILLCERFFLLSLKRLVTQALNWPSMWVREWVCASCDGLTSSGCAPAPHLVTAERLPDTLLTLIRNRQKFQNTQTALGFNPICFWKTKMGMVKSHTMAFCRVI